MARKSDRCIFMPTINGKASELYRGLSTKFNTDKPFVNWVYTKYLVPGVKEAMDKAGYERNSQGEHSADDVYKFLDVNEMANNRAISLDTASRLLGIIDSSGKPIDFNAEDAYAKAVDINNNVKGRVAFVVQADDKFNVILENRDSRTQLRSGEVNLQLAQWQAFKEGMTAAGMDVDVLVKEVPELVNPLRVTDFLTYANSLQRVSKTDLTERDIKVILTIGKDNSVAKTLINRWGDIDNAAKNIYEILQNQVNYAQSTVNLIYRGIDDALKVTKQSLVDLSNKIRLNIVPDFKKASEEYQMDKKLNELHKRFGIDSEVIVRTSDRIRTLSDASADAVIALKRQIELLKKKNGDNLVQEELEDALYTLLAELKNKKYYSGLLTFLKQASNYSGRVNKILTDIPHQGTALEYAKARADAYMAAKNYLDIYQPIVNALSHIENLVIDESITKESKDTLKDVSKELLDSMTKYQSMLDNLREEVMIDMCREVFGDEPIQGKSIADFVKMVREDSTIMDYLYSMCRVSNPLIAAMGTIIRDAQTERDATLNQYAERIRKANADLEGNSEFMYELVDGQYYLLSPYDWSKFNSARREAYKEYAYNQGLSGFELKDAMNAWDEENMDDIVVDETTGRTEKVPNSNYLKAVNPLFSLTDSQLAYYNTMMQIKGELGSLLPAYAQKQFLPPQKRASWDDVIKRGVQGKMSAKEVALNLLDRMNPIKIRQDDTKYAQNSININGEEYVNASGNFDSTLIRRIPIYYMNRLDNQNELLMDFSSALSSFAATALNYDAMDNIKNTIELMSDFVGEQPIAHRKGEKNLADIVRTDSVAVAKTLRLRSEGSRTQALLEGFVEQHLYGITLKDTNTASRMLQALINYTSMRQLTVNVKGALSNALVGEAQMIIEAVAGDVNRMFKRDGMYGIKNYAAAHLILVGNKLTPGVYSDHITGNRSSKAVLLEDFFDPLQEVYNDLGSRRFSAFARLHGGFNTMAMYSVGESLIHLVNMYAVLDHAKVLMDGKKTSLYNAITVSDQESDNRHLVLKDNVTDLDGNALTMDSDFIKDIKNKIRYINQQTHGSMNTEDKGLIQRRIAGRAVMNFRQWMVEHYSRRYRGRHWDGSLHEWTEGYWTTVGKFMKNYVKDYAGFITTAKAVWNDLDDNQKNNFSRCCAEVALLAALHGLSFALGEPADHKKEWWYRMWIYQVKRLILDERASVPWGIPQEAKTIIQSPVASVNTVNAIFYPVMGLAQGDFLNTIKSGRYKGWNKYGRNLLKYTVPFYGQIDQLMYMDEEDYIYSMFGNQRSY